jgi:hypothetical protein
MRVLFCLLMLISTLAFASRARCDSTQTLPAGVRSMQVRFGYVSGIDQTFGAGGQLTTLGDSKSITFNATTLARTSADAQNLVSALNSLGSQNLGSQINLGTLKVDTKPRITYEAPVFAYGISKKWTIGFGLPVIQYSNDVHLSSAGSNADAYKRMGLTGFSTQLDRALNINLISEVSKMLADRGYKSLASRQETFVADAQIAALYQIARSKDFEAVYQASFTLPTGPANDPDDLLATNLYGRTGLENSVALGFRLNRHFAFIPHAGILIYAPDNVQARVPNSDDDTLPDSTQKQTVHRQLGMSEKVGADLNWLMTSAWTSSIGSEIMKKGSDKYTGSDSALRYDLLSKDTETQSVRARTGITYSTVNSYMKKRSAIPCIIGLEISDVLAGVNVLRETRAELSFMLFF